MKHEITIAICLTAVAVAAANFAVGRAASNSVPRQTMRRINAAGPVIGVLGMGNSLMAAGFDPTAVQDTFQNAGRPVIALNGALGATTAIEQLALTRLALRHHTVQDLVYGFSDQQMTTGGPLKNSYLIGNHAMLYYQEPQLTLQYARFDLLDRLEFQICRCCALLRERGNIWAKVEKMRRAMEEVGMPPQETNQFGRRADFDLLESANPNEFARQCREKMSSGDFLSPVLQELFREAEARGSRITVVEMPMRKSILRPGYMEGVPAAKSPGGRARRRRLPRREQMDPRRKRLPGSSAHGSVRRGAVQPAVGGGTPAARFGSRLPRSLARRSSTLRVSSHQIQPPLSQFRCAFSPRAACRRGGSPCGGACGNAKPVCVTLVRLTYSIDNQSSTST